MKKFIIFLGMWALMLVLWVIGVFVLDSTILRRAGEPGLLTIITILYFPIVLMLMTLPAYLLMRFITKP